MILLTAALTAPLMGALRRWPKRLHAVNIDQVVQGWERGTFHSVCGLRGLKLVGTEIEQETYAAPWPPRLKGLPSGYVRCQDCYISTGKMRPRTEFRSKNKL